MWRTKMPLAFSSPYLLVQRPKQSDLIDDILFVECLIGIFPIGQNAPRLEFFTLFFQGIRGELSSYGI